MQEEGEAGGHLDCWGRLARADVLLLSVEAGEEEILPCPDHEAVLGGLHVLHVESRQRWRASQALVTPRLRTETRHWETLSPPSRLQSWEDARKDIQTKYWIGIYCLCLFDNLHRDVRVTGLNLSLTAAATIILVFYL